MSFRKISLVLVLVVGFSCPFVLKACTLAEHDWKLEFSLSLPLPSLAGFWSEFLWLEREWASSPFSRGIVVLENPSSALYSLITYPFFGGWCSKIPWQIVDFKEGVLKTARKNRETPDDLAILGIDSPVLCVTFHRDSNSPGICRRVTMIYQTRGRAIVLKKNGPSWAEEKILRLGASLVFFQVPVPDRIISFTFLQENQSPLANLENSELVKDLISRDLLKQRVLSITPVSPQNYSDFFHEGNLQNVP